MNHSITRRDTFRLAAGAGVGAAALNLATPAQAVAPDDAVVFLVTNDVHACRTVSGLSDGCLAAGKTDPSMLRHVAAINAVETMEWPVEVASAPSGFERAGQVIGKPLGLVVAGDLTDDGGGQIALPSEGTQLLQFSQRYSEGTGPDRVHMPVWLGLGNHDLDQDGPPDHVDWYRRELRDYVEMNHRPGVFFKPPVPARSYEPDSDSYSWDWGDLHLVQTQRFAGDTAKGAVSALDWLREDLKENASDGRPVVVFQHYGWDDFSIERWDPAKNTFDPQGTGDDHWWSQAQRDTVLAALKGTNVLAIFHGHEHPSTMIYNQGGLDVFKPKAAFMGGFAVVRASTTRFEVLMAEAGENGTATFTKAFAKAI
ncbi:metallophosphoesterase [Mesorhizobium sp. RP14(2022)]|uniref:Metallophosphoesterase n=1 Tax=Mesorhizobium liriopis TaxID=2953882 RepID=A0ABT1C6A4_9HYPH|nr:metallophosphoesterase [Mesorhizobium liriopis]MCO6050018.1 metallophosphoesterase [Mesorhizobium liriopis]